MADVLRRVQALHARGVSRRVPDRGAVSHRVRHGGRAADICNGCGYCVRPVPFGVIDRREGDGRAWKCTLCYDRLEDGMEPACAKACPTESIQFGPLDELRERAAAAGQRAAREAGSPAPSSTWSDPDDGIGGAGRSSCCWMSRRCTGCRRTRSSPRATCRACGSTWPLRPVPCCSAAWPPRFAGTCAHEPDGRARGWPARPAANGKWRPSRRKRRPRRGRAWPGGPRAGALWRARPRPAGT